jgi:putative flippase GtrA
MNPIGNLWDQSETRYIIIGIWNTLFAITIFAIIHILFSRKITLTETLTIAFVFGVVQSFATQKKFVWRSSEKVSAEFPKFLLVSTLQYIANVLLLKTLTSRFNANPITSQIFVTAALILITYLVLKFWVFKVAEPYQDPVITDYSDESLGNL